MTTRPVSRVERLYHAALQRPPSEREAFVAREADGDAALALEVRSLLALEEDARGLLQQPVAEAATARLAAVQGTRLGHYEIVELIGAGGMGEVYRARDTRLGRDVALKLLPAAFAADPERLARFEREARALAALDHPGIAAIHGIEEHAGVRFLVLERVAGETLAERLGTGPLALHEALGLGVQIAEALAAAHERGILHRDVKPSNVQVTPEGRAKLLDFGLAKALAPGEGSSETAATATASGAGVVRGTAPYMSPEQARGAPVDRRTDVWAFGCVLYEMLAGERAFPGETSSEAIARVLEAEPRWEALPDGTPALVRALLRRCLRKEEARRLHDLADAAIELEEALAGEGGDDEVVPAPPARQTRRARRWEWGVAVVLAALLAGASVELWRRPAQPGTSAAPVVRSQLELTPGRPLLGRTHRSARTELALSPDGTLLVWASDAEPDGLMRPSAGAALELRRLDSGEVTRLAGTEGASQPFFSPDGRWVGFFARDGERWTLRKVRVDGGLPIDLAELTDWPMGASWGADGTIFLGGSAETLEGIRAVSSQGGPPRDVTTADPDREVSHRLPRALPGGGALLFTAMPHAFGLGSRVEAVRLASGERKVVVEDAADARDLPTGHLVFARQGVLMAAPFDAERLELAGTPVPLVPDVAQALNEGTDTRNSGALQLAVSDTGMLAYASGGLYEDNVVRFLLLDEEGRAEPFTGFDKPLLNPQMHLSPDGRRLACIQQARSGRAWVFDLERRTFAPLTRSGLAGSPRWSPDGTQIALSWSEAGPQGIWVFPASGGGDRERLASEGYSPGWSPDGRFLAFCHDSDILLYSFEDRRVVPFVADEGTQRYPEFSPDGRWLAYGSTETGRGEVYVTSFPDRERTLTVSSSGGTGPVWSRDGRRLHYVTTQGSATRRLHMMAVEVRPGPPLSLGPPVSLFELPPGYGGMAMRYYEILPDGRFLVGVREDRELPPPITRLELVQGWFAELERLSPTGR